MATSDSGTTIHLAPSRDIRISVSCRDECGKGDARKAFVVSSAVMCLASPIWSKIFSPAGQFLEAAPCYGIREVRFGGDNAKALLLILRIIHLQFREVPEEIRFNDLLNVAVLCDKYDMAEIVNPWIPRWMGQWESSATDVGREGWLFISWTFGMRRMYEKVAKNLVLNLAIGDDGQTPDNDGTALTRRLPPGAIGQ